MEEIGGETAQEWACGECKTCRLQDLHPYTVKLLRLRLLKTGGYPFRANDLTLEEWVDLGRISDALRPKFEI
jgi:hypothetical protein